MGKRTFNWAELKPEVKQVWQLSLPAILTQITTIAMQYIDSAMVGALGAAASAAIGLVVAMTWLYNGVLSAVSAGERRCRNTYGRPDSRKLCPERARYFSGRAEEHPAFPDFSSVCSQSESRRCCYYRSPLLQRYRQCAFRIQDPPHAGGNRISYA